MQTLQEYLNQNYERNKFGKEICGFGELYTNTRAIYYSFFVGDKEYKVFAFVSTPIMTKPKNGYPAVLILHGGNGMAYAEVTKMWADKGFVAIAPDLNGKCGKNLGERSIDNPSGGPNGYGFSGINTDNPWAFFSVLSAMKAIDVLSEIKEVDKSKICSVGLSWGGYLNLLLMSQDKRIAAGTVIYSSAYTRHSEFGNNILENYTEEERENYFRYIEPTNYLSGITCPVLFTAGTTDRAFKMINRQKTADNISGSPYFALRKEYYHGNMYGFEQPESAEFLKRILHGKKIPQPEIKILKNGVIRVKAFRRSSEIRILATKDDLEKTSIQKWRVFKAVHGDSILLPEKYRVFFVTEKENGNVWSSGITYIK